MLRAVLSAVRTRFPFARRPSEFRRIADRVAQIRASAMPDAYAAFLSHPIRIGEEDYFLMGCDNSCARRNHPVVPDSALLAMHWFAGAPDLPADAARASGNCHLTERDDGTLEVDDFCTGLPKACYQASPEEVAWHCLRVKELRSAEVPRERRIAILRTEAAEQPWLAMS